MSGENTGSRLEIALRDRNLCAALLKDLEQILAGREMRFMEVCGTHTVALFQSGLRSMLPASIKHISGPGCPVCVTHEAEIAMLLDVASRNDVLLASFGDLLRVPGPGGRTLKHCRAEGGNIEIVYSPLDALTLARKNPQKELVFTGIGFETTAPTVAAAVLQARAQGIGNFSVLSFHKLVPPALDALLTENASNVNAFLLPGHVAAITGPKPFEFLARNYAKPAAIGGFEPVELLLALRELARQFVTGKPRVANVYERAVAPDGNPRARQIMATVFQSGDALWRGLGLIKNSGLNLAPDFAEFDARNKFSLALSEIPPLPGCKCGSILKGLLQPSQCPLFAKKCTPATPVGPCMVSTEGSCAAHYKYGNY